MSFEVNSAVVIMLRVIARDWKVLMLFFNIFEVDRLPNQQIKAPVKFTNCCFCYFCVNEAITSDSNNRGVKRPNEMKESTGDANKRRQNFNSETTQDTEKRRLEKKRQKRKQMLYKFHPFSSEYYGVVRCGRTVSQYPNLDGDLYSQLIDLHDKVSYLLSKAATDYIKFVVNSVNDQVLQPVPNVLEF
ncbi:hypothetical protein BY458DRAFT_549549 [Sporodiniella umbellata]|nr:hypothetical protein BY458DRAFT_549549 [Sporodiniella umbellata]